jgi:hypothetical protein
MTGLPAYVLVKNEVVYRLARPMRVREEHRYVRMSVPPDVVPGTRSKFRPTYRPGRLPEHIPVDLDEANRIVHASLCDFETRLAAEKARTAIDPPQRPAKTAGAARPHNLRPPREDELP